MGGGGGGGFQHPPEYFTVDYNPIGESVIFLLTINMKAVLYN